MNNFSLVFVAAVALFIGCDAFPSDTQTLPVLMPHVNPYEDELYHCAQVKLDKSKSLYMVGFQPNANMNTIHHMVLFGCKEPGTPDPYWDCGELPHANRTTMANPCKSGTQVLYGWARNAEQLSLPEGVGFQIGKDTDVNYLVLELHYARKFPESYLDNSGVTVLYTETPQPKLGGILALASGGIIPAHKETHMETYCSIREDKVIHPFAFRVHTHDLGKVVSGYHITKDEQGQHQWTLMGKASPLGPQMFYPSNSTAPIKQGDIMAFRCTMINFRDTDTKVGPTNKDEMCNYYIMYYVENGTPLRQKYCWSDGPPKLSWSKGKHPLNNIPDDVSTL